MTQLEASIVELFCLRLVFGLKTQVALKEDLIDLVRKEVLEKLSQSKLPEAVKVLWVGLDLHRFHEKSGDIRFIEVPIVLLSYLVTMCL